MSNKNILITGITGQDGIFLTNKILKKDSSIKIAGFSEIKIILVSMKNLNTLTLRLICRELIY